jgi:hypothetical protein
MIKRMGMLAAIMVLFSAYLVADNEPTKEEQDDCAQMMALFKSTNGRFGWQSCGG